MTYDQVLDLASGGNKSARDYLLKMSAVFRVWDDCYDGDKSIDKDLANMVFSDLAFDLSRNEFYNEHRIVLESFVFSAWNAWMDSNIWRGKEGIKGICAWFIRDYCNDLDQLVAYLVRGASYARQVSPIIREYYLNRLAKNGIDGFVKE